MTTEAEQLMAEALKRVKLNGGFDPAELGARIGLSQAQAEAAARALSNAGVLVLGFDGAAHFSPAFRKNQNPEARDASRKKNAKGTKSSKRAAGSRAVAAKA